MKRNHDGKDDDDNVKDCKCFKDINGINGAIYRVDGDGLKTSDEIFKASKILKYRFKGIVKRLGKK